MRHADTTLLNGAGTRHFDPMDAASASDSEAANAAFGGKDLEPRSKAADVQSNAGDDASECCDLDKFLTEAVHSANEHPPKEMPHCGASGKRAAKHAATLKAAVDVGHIDPRSPTVQLMDRSLSEEDKKAYRCMSNAAKSEFRMRWAQQKFAALTVTSKQKSEEWRRIDTTHGEYMSASKVFREEGGTTADIEPTQRLLKKAAAMGEPFIKWNSFTERYDILYLKNSFKEEFHRCWGIFEKEVESKQSVQDEAAGSKLSKSDRGVASATTPTGGKAKRQAPPRADEQDNKKAKDDTPNSKLVIAAALKTKRLYSTVTSAANNLLVDIKSNDAWEWAQSEKQLHGLTAAQAAVSAVMDSFAMQFVSRDLQQLKRTMSSDVLQQHLSKFSLQLNPVLETLQKEASVLVRMQQARL